MSVSCQIALKHNIAFKAPAIIIKKDKYKKKRTISMCILKVFMNTSFLAPNSMGAGRMK